MPRAETGSPAQSVGGVLEGGEREAVEQVEQIGYVDDGDPLYVALHLPDRPTGAVVVCGSIGWEFAKNYRREVLLGRELAARGLAVVRLHYRGLGESAGAFERSTIASMAEDASRAWDLLRYRTGFAAPGLVGIRTGALVAAALADRIGPVPVALWDPVVSGAHYVRELTQIQRVWQMTRGVAEPAPRDAGDGDDGVPLEVLGYRLSANLIAELGTTQLGPWLTQSPHAVLSLHVGGIPRLVNAARSELPEEAATGGPRWQAEAVPGRIDWWMKRPAFEPEESAPVTTALISRTVSWLTERTGGVAESSADGSSSAGSSQIQAVAGPEISAVASVSGVRREAVRVAVGDDRLAGVFVGPQVGESGLAAVILNCGSYHPVSGPVGLWSLLADKLAALGVPSLRVAYRGVDESTGTVTDFDLTRPRTEELRAARAFLTERGFTRHVLLGGCLGARTCCAADLDGVAGLGLVSLPWHRESLGTGADSRKTAAERGEGPVGWLSPGLLDDVRRCVAADVPMRIVYCEAERYLRDFRDAKQADVLGSFLPSPIGNRLGMRLVAGSDSMLEPHAVSGELAAFVATLAGRG